MAWVWDEDGDAKVSDIWMLRDELARSRRVVYTRWFQGRVTLFSRKVFVGLLNRLHPRRHATAELGTRGKTLLDLLLDNSPQSTKTLKKHTRTELNWSESDFNKGMGELWNRLLVVGCGDIEDGAFPSLSVGATQLMFEDLWRQAEHTPNIDAFLEQYLPLESPWYRHYRKLTAGQAEEAKTTGKKKIIKYQDLVSGTSRR